MPCTAKAPCAGRANKDIVRPCADPNMSRLGVAAKTAYKNVTHCIFDLDGLLLDTENKYTEATQNIIQPYGKTYDWDLKVQVMGLTGVEVAKKLIELLDLPLTWEEYFRLAHEQYKTLMPSAQLMPDTESIYKNVFTGMVGKYGKRYTPEIQMKIMGTPDVDGVNVLVKELNLPTPPNEFLQEFRLQASKTIGTCRIMPGAERLVKHLHKNNIPIAVATSSHEDSYKLKSTNHKEFFSMFHHIVTGGSDPEVKHGKPAPDVFLVCASRFPDNPSPETCLVFEDAPNGVKAARAAGMQVVMVPDENTDPQLCKDATLKLHSLEEMQPELFGLPALQ